MLNLRIVATQNCNNPSLVKKLYFIYLVLLNIHKFHPKGPFPIKRPICYACTICFYNEQELSCRCIVQTCKVIV